MIKKLLGTLLLAALIGIADLSAQICTPDVSCIPAGKTYGICPDSATGMAIGTVGIAYTQTMSMMVPANGADFGFSTATITSIDITSVDSLAPGLSYQCVPSSCSFPASTNNCILITGTPTTPWNKQVIVHATAHGYIFSPSASLSLPQTNQQYRSIVNPATSGIETLDLNKFDVQQNMPNPFDGKAEIRFSSVSTADIEFKVYNMLGSIVYANKYKAEKGVNTIVIESNSFAPGVYVYSVKNGDKTITKRMVVSK